MTKNKIKLNYAEVGRLLKSKNVEYALKRAAKKVQAKLKDRPIQSTVQDVYNEPVAKIGRTRVIVKKPRLYNKYQQGAYLTWLLDNGNKREKRWAWVSINKFGKGGG